MNDPETPCCNVSLFQDQRGDDGKENVVRSNENEERLKIENTKLVKENNELKTELEETKFKACKD